MDTGDGDPKPEDGLKIAVSILSGDKYSGNGKLEAGGDDNNNDDEEDGDTTDGAPPILEAAKTQIEIASSKRKHVQSQRMKEYQQQLTTYNVTRQERVCPHCGRALMSGPGYRYHLKTHSSDNESFTCDMCHKSFKSANGLKYHKKRKRCRGGLALAPSSTTGSSETAESSSKQEPSSEAHERLMELATIATGPQSPLLQGSGGRSSSTSSFFNDPEKSAVMVLSSMKRKSCSESRKALEKPGSSFHPPESQKPKRPMNGFMLFAQRYRAELKKQHPDINNRMISIKLSEEWSKLKDDERLKWKEDARLKAEQVQKVFPNCWKRKK